MKKSFFLALVPTILIGCSSGTPTEQSEQFVTMTGGQSVGDTTSLYWYSEQLALPHSASDFVASGDYGWYRSDYRWKSNKLKEVIRKGELLQENLELAPYETHLRFNDEGEAVYQRYRLDGKVLPLTPEQIGHIQREAQALRTVTSEQNRKGERLYQGYWDGEKFTTCNGQVFSSLEFNQTLPTFVINRLANLDSYAAFLGTSSPNKLTITDIYMLHDENFDCIEPVSYIED
ncbi:DUF1481 domain-containing protein [Vibrio sp. HN007]|uniref:DUF1481 domain-containing protein n=1 Tax=Vibrio iocasae TaxID=3098914 RepID=UPI0035D485ED